MTTFLDLSLGTRVTLSVVVEHDDYDAVGCAVLTIVRRSGRQDGLHAWRLLLMNYEPRSKETMMMKRVGRLTFGVSQERLLDCVDTDINFRVSMLGLLMETSAQTVIS